MNIPIPIMQQTFFFSNVIKVDFINVNTGEIDVNYTFPTGTIGLQTGEFIRDVIEEEAKTALVNRFHIVGKSKGGWFPTIDKFTLEGYFVSPFILGQTKKIKITGR